jgi:PAS domain S-box-containing protein/putative nucleotidyltransferase with HDIG domain
VKIQDFVSPEVADRLVDALVLVGPDCSVLDANAAALDCYGYSRDQMLSLRVPDIRGPQDREHAVAQYREAMRHAILFEADAQRSDGTRFPMECRSVPVGGESNQAVLSIVRNISERRQIAAERARAEEYFRATFERADVGIAHVGPDGTWLRVNRWLCDMLGYSEEELLSGTLFDITHPESLGEDARHLRQLLAGEEPRYDAEKRYIRKDGLPMWAYLNVTPVGEKGCAPDYFMCVMTDITDRKVREQELAESQRFVNCILDTSPNMIYIYDLVEQRNVYVNREVAEFLGYSSAQIHAFGPALFEHIMCPEDAGPVAAHHARFRSADSMPLEAEIEYRMRHSDGEWRWLRSRDTAFARDEQGRVTQILGFSEDITEAKAAGQELARQREHIERTLTSVIDIATNIVEARDSYTAGHQRRVAELAVAIAREVGMPEAEVADVRVASLLHDIGKTRVPAEILSKPGTLSTLEMEVLRTHADAGYEIISSAHMEEPIAEIVRQHHERCDGSGYPRGLTAGQTHRGAKVLAVADVVEAMMSHRPYRPAYGIEAALAEIGEGAGRLYDADVSKACIALFRDGRVELSAQITGLSHPSL